MNNESETYTKQVLFEKVSDRAFLFDLFITTLNNCTKISNYNLFIQYTFYLDNDTILFVVSDDGFIFIREGFYKRFYRNYNLKNSKEKTFKDNDGFLSPKKIKETLNSFIKKELNMRVETDMKIFKGATIDNIEIGLFFQKNELKVKEMIKNNYDK